MLLAGRGDGAGEVCGQRLAIGQPRELVEVRHVFDDAFRFDVSLLHAQVVDAVGEAFGELGKPFGIAFIPKSVRFTVTAPSTPARCPATPVTSTATTTDFVTP